MYRKITDALSFIDRLDKLVQRNGYRLGRLVVDNVELRPHVDIVLLNGEAGSDGGSDVLQPLPLGAEQWPVVPVHRDPDFYYKSTKYGTSVLDYYLYLDACLNNFVDRRETAAEHHHDDGIPNFYDNYQTPVFHDDYRQATPSHDDYY